MSKYLLDANVFIEAKRRAYPMDFCPGFWAWLDQMNQSGVVYSIEAIADELIPTNDDVSAWARPRVGRFFLPHATDAAMLQSLPIVSTWAASQRYNRAAITQFLGCADYYLVSYAHANSYTVVTHERHDAGAKQVKIPTVCNGLNIPCLNPFQMLRAENAKFMLGGNAACNCNAHS